MEGWGSLGATGLQPSHAAPTELDTAGRRLRYKHGAPTGACTDPCEDPCKEQGKRSATPLWLGHRPTLLDVPGVRKRRRRLHLPRTVLVYETMA